MNMQDYKNAVDRIEISPKMRTEVLDMTTTTTRRNHISMTRIVTAAAAFVLVAGIGGTVGYGMLKARQDGLLTNSMAVASPGEGSDAALSAITENPPPTVPDLSAFGLDAAAFSPAEPAEDDAFKEVLWVYRGDAPACTLYAYHDGMGNCVMLRPSGQILSVCSTTQADEPVEDPDALLQTYLQALSGDLEGFVPMQTDGAVPQNEYVVSKKLQREHQNGFAEVLTGDVGQYGNFNLTYISAPADGVSPYSREDYDKAFELTVNALNCAATDMDAAGLTPNGRNMVCLMKPEQDKDDVLPLFISADDGKVYGIYSVNVQMDEGEFIDVPLLITPEKININAQGDEEDENTAAVYDFERSMPKLYSFLEKSDLFPKNAADGTEVYTTAVANPDAQTTLTTTAAPQSGELNSAELEESTGLTDEQRTFRNDFASVTLESVSYNHYGDLMLSYQVVIDTLKLEEKPEGVMCTPELTFTDEAGEVFEPTVLQPACNQSVILGQNNEIYQASVTYSTLRETDIQFKDFELIYIDLNTGAEHRAKLTGEGFKIHLPDIPVQE